MRLDKSRTECVECNFRHKVGGERGEVIINRSIVLEDVKVYTFRWILHCEGEIKDGITQIVRVG